jgi:IS30 family transposase
MKTGYKRLSLDNRVTIEKLLSHEYGDSEIARASNLYR